MGGMPPPGMIPPGMAPPGMMPPGMAPPGMMRGKKIKKFQTKRKIYKINSKQ